MMPAYKLTRFLDIASKTYKTICGSFPGMTFDEILFILDLIRDCVLKAKSEKEEDI